jgi:hypothetical protein
MRWSWPTIGARPTAGSSTGSLPGARGSRRLTSAVPMTSSASWPCGRTGCTCSRPRPAGPCRGATPATRRRRTSWERGWWPRPSPRRVDRRSCSRAACRSMEPRRAAGSTPTTPTVPRGTSPTSRRSTPSSSSPLCPTAPRLRPCVLRFGIVYGPGPGGHEAPESVTVVDTFRRRVAAGEPLRLDDGGPCDARRRPRRRRRAHPARRPLRTGTANVAAETVTVAGSRLSRAGRSPPAPCLRASTLALRLPSPGRRPPRAAPPGSPA